MNRVISIQLMLLVAASSTLTSPADADEITRQRNTELGTRALLNKKTVDAERFFARALTQIGAEPLIGNDRFELIELLCSTYSEEGKTNDIVQLCETQIVELEQKLSNSDPRILSIKNKLLSIYVQQKNFDALARLLDEELKSKTAENEITEPRIRFIENISLILLDHYKASKKYAKCEQLCFELLGLYLQNNYSYTQLNFQKNLNLLAEFYMAENKYSSAIPLLEMYLRILELKPRKDDTSLLSVIKELGQSYSFSGDQTRALALFQRELTIAEKSLAADDIRSANALVDCATINLVCKNYQISEEMYKRAWTIFKSRPDDMDKKFCRSGYVKLLETTGRKTEAALLEKE